MRTKDEVEYAAGPWYKTFLDTFGLITGIPTNRFIPPAIKPEKFKLEGVRAEE